MDQSRRIAKLSPPVVRDVLFRERLFRELDRHEKVASTWIAAPGGFGKTVLVASYLSRGQRPSLWYTIDTGDGVASTFFQHLATAASAWTAGAAERLPDFREELAPAVAEFSRLFFRSFYAALPDPFTLVFDNFHDAPESSPLASILSQAISEAPAGVRIIITSRRFPPRTFARLRANGRVALLEGRELRLNEREAGELAALRGSDRGEASKPFERTGGWAAGFLLMLACGKYGIRCEKEGIECFREVLDYFEEEVLSGLGLDVRSFLLGSALFPSMTGSMARRLMGADEAEDLLEKLHRENLFTEKRFDDRGVVFQYHPLFREFLLAKGERKLTGDEAGNLRTRAAAILEQEGEHGAAIDLCLAGALFDEAARIVKGHAALSVRRGSYRLLDGWLEALPAETVGADPWLLYWRGVARVVCRTGEAYADVERAHDIFLERGEEEGRWTAFATALSIIGTIRGLGLYERWLAMLNTLPREFPAPELGDRITVGLFQALVICAPDHRQFDHWRDKALALAREGKDVNLRLEAAYFLYMHFCWTGRLGEMERMLDLMARLIKEELASPLARILYWYCRGNRAWHLFRHEDCLEAVEQGLAVARESGIHVADHILYENAVISSLSRGDLRAARASIRRMEEHIAVPEDLAYVDWMVLWELLLEKEYPGGMQRYRRWRESTRARLFLFGEIMPRTVAALHCLEISPEEGRAVLREIGALAGRMKSRMAEYILLLIKACYDFRSGDGEKGHEALRRAFGIGREEGYVNYYGWSGTVMSFLCAKALEQGTEPLYARDLILLRGLVPPSGEPAPDGWPWQVDVLTLGRFEVRRLGRVIEFDKKAQKRPLDLLKAIISLGGAETDESNVIDCLWPDLEGDAAIQAYKIALHRLRALIGRDAVIRRNGLLFLDRSLCRVDLWTCEETVRGAEKTLSDLNRNRAAPDGTPLQALRERIDRLLALYAGPFLPSDHDRPWTAERRERTESRVLDLVEKAGRLCAGTGDHLAAVDLYKRGLLVKDPVETFYQGLMESYCALGRLNDAVSAYERLKSLLSRLHEEPSPALTFLYRSLR